MATNSVNNMHNLTTLIKRLEAATTRLEDIASSTIELPQAVPALQQTLASPQSGPSTSSTPAPPPAPAAAPKPPQEPLPESIEEFQGFVDNTVGKFVELSNQVGGLIAEQAATLRDGFEAQGRFLLIASKSRKPDITGPEMNVYQDLIKPINEALIEVGHIKESNRGSDVFNNLSAVAEGALVLAWITVDHKPYNQVEESLGAAQFFGNRVLNQNKDKNSAQVDWVQAFYQIFRDLADYIKQYFPNGVTWNPKGPPAQDVAKTFANSTSGSTAKPAAAAAAPPPPPPPPPAGAGAPPPPPPPGPPPVLQIGEQKPEPAAAGSGLGAVFSELNKGEAVTAGLRKVDKSEMTHKNPSLRAGSTVGDGPARGKSPAPVRKPKPENMRVKKPPKKELEGNKWTIENYDKESENIEIEASMSHSILISKCNHTTIVIKGKANAVTVENTTRLSLLVESLVSSVDVVKSSGLALQVTGNVPTVLMDSVDGAQIYFSKESTATKIFSSKSSGINLNVISGPEDDFKEVPLPSQICSYYDPKKEDLVNEIVAYDG